MTLLTEALKMPENSYVNDRLYKKMFLEQPDLSSADKRLIKEKIKNITLHNVLNLQSTGITPFVDDTRAYRELYLIELELEDTRKHKRIAELIQMTIPHPVCLILTSEDKTTITLAQKRFNQNDKTKITVEEYLFTEWFDPRQLDDRQQTFITSLDSKNFPYTNFYQFYSELFNYVLRFNLSKHTGQFSKDSFKTLPAEEIKDKKDEFESIENAILDLRKRIQRESNFNQKLRMNGEIGALKNRKKVLGRELSKDDS